MNITHRLPALTQAEYEALRAVQPPKRRRYSKLFLRKTKRQVPAGRAGRYPKTGQLTKLADAYRSNNR